MYVTEKEAAKKWCCQARHEAAKQAKENITIPCIGSWCMAWRWDIPTDVIADPNKQYGHCGLAGSPEW